MKYRQYIYSLEDISEGKKEAFKAIVPAFDNAIVFGDSIRGIEEGIQCLIEDEEVDRKTLKTARSC